jgi:hypothetical protein
MKIAKHMLVAGSLALMLTASLAHAQFKLPAALGGKGSASSGNANDGDAAAAQDSLVRTFVASQTEVVTAQALLAHAYGLKDQAALLEAQQKALSSGGVKEASDLQTSLDISNKASAEIAAQQASQTSLSEEGKKYYAESLPHFAKGVVGTHRLVGEVSKFGSTAKNSMGGGGLAGLGSGMTKLKVGMFVVKATPGYSKAVFDTFRKTVSIGQSNGVKVPTDATQALSDLGT